MAETAALGRDPKTCTHDKFEAKANVFKSPDEAHAGVTLRVRCAECGTRFRFDPERVDVDGRAITVSIVPDPEPKG